MLPMTLDFSYQIVNPLVLLLNLVHESVHLNFGHCRRCFMCTYLLILSSDVLAELHDILYRCEDPGRGVAPGVCGKEVAR